MTQTAPGKLGTGPGGPVGPLRMCGNDEHIVETFRGAVVIKHVATFRRPAAHMFIQHLGVSRFRPGTLTPDLFFSENRLPGRFITPSELGETMLLDF